MEQPLYSPPPMNQQPSLYNPTIPNTYELEARIKTLERQVNSLVESIGAINRQMNHDSLIKKLIYYFVVGLVYFLNKEFGTNVNALHRSNWWLFNILLCIALLLFRRPLMYVFNCLCR